MHFSLEGVLERPVSLGIHQIEFEFKVHPAKDSGIRLTGADTLRTQRNFFSHALMVLDFEGSGTHFKEAVELESELDKQLRVVWGDDAKAIVISPEVDVWMWGSDTSIQEVVEWRSKKRIREWLKENQFDFTSEAKPLRPKEALEAILQETKQPRSSSLYKRIAQKISLRKCTDAAFQRLQSQLQIWFPENTP